MAFYEYSYYCLPSTIAAVMILFPLFMSMKRWDLGGRVKVLTFLLAQSLLVMLSETLLIAAKTPELTLFWDKIMYTGIILYPASLFHLNLSYAKRRLSRYGGLVYLPSLFFLVLLPTDLFIAGVEPTYWGWGKLVGPAYSWFQIYAGIFFVAYCVFILYQFFTERSPRLKNEILCLTIPTIPTVIVGCMIVIILVLFNITKLNIMVHSICISWCCITLSIAMLSKRPYDVYAHLPWFNFEKKQIQKDVAELVKTGAMPLDYEQIIETLYKVLGVDIAIHTTNGVYANLDCNPVFADFSNKALFNQPGVLIRHEIAPNRPEHEILSRHHCDLLASLFCGGQFVGAVRLGVGLTDRLYSKYDVTLIYDLLAQLRLSLFYGNAVPMNPASVILHQLGDKVCSIQKSGNVRVYLVDYDEASTTQEKDGSHCRITQLPPHARKETDPSDFETILDSIHHCPECGSTHIYTAVKRACFLDHQKQQIIEVVQLAGTVEQGVHGCFDCLHQWRSYPEPTPPELTKVINFNAFKTAKQ